MEQTLEKVISAKVATKDLRTALKVIAKAMHRTPIVPMLESILLEVKDGQLMISGSDLISVVNFSLPVEQEAEPGIFTMDFARLNRIAKYVSDESVRFEVSGDEKLKTIKLSWEDSIFTMKEDFNYLDMPRFPSSQNDFGIFSVDINQLREGLKLCRKSVTSDDLRPAMTGIYFDSYGDNMKIVSTDGHRLTRYETDVQFNFPSFIINKSISDIIEANRSTKSASVEIHVGKTTVSFIFDNCTVVTKKMDERYPDYENAISKDVRVQVNASLNLLLNRLELARVLSNEYTQQAVFVFAHNHLKISTDDFDCDVQTFQAIRVETVSDESEIKIGFNARLLKNTLSGFSGDVEIKMTAFNRSALFHPKSKFGKSLTLLLMPIMLSTYD